MKDKLGDVIKELERKAEGYPSGDTPIIIRLDGKNFSKWTKGLDKPYDLSLSSIMKEVTETLVDYTNASVGYTQSDEITLVINRNAGGGELFFSGRYQKLSSVLASLATYKFNELVRETIPQKKGKMALFDARTFEVPDDEMAIKVLEWRAEDCRRNSISCLAQSVFSHKQLQKKNCGEMKRMLREVDKNWDDSPEFFRNGYYVKRKKVTRKFTTEEMDSLPAKHFARQNPDLEFERSIIEVSTESILDSKNKIGFIK